ncbi:MAG: hypothetical protein EKK49_03970 [Rhodocyclaceae bacterium]|nr:MAG: hypothetical protein EKK49_03970 [Rhodocyclaceae bacterium]
MFLNGFFRARSVREVEQVFKAT